MGTRILSQPHPRLYSDHVAPPKRKEQPYFGPMCFVEDVRILVLLLPLCVSLARSLPLSELQFAGL